MMILPHPWMLTFTPPSTKITWRPDLYRNLTTSTTTLSFAAAVVTQAHQHIYLQRLNMESAAETINNANSGALVDAVFFDLDETLVLTHSADRVALEAVKCLLASRLPQIQHQAVIDRFVQDFVSQPWDPEKQIDVIEWRAGLWNRGLISQGCDDMLLAKDLQRLFDEERLLAFKWTNGVEVLIRDLQSEGVKVGIITNGHPKIQRAKLRACRAEELFNTILVGGEEPNEKPHKDIFLKACQIAGSEPERSIMVGDNLKTDIKGGYNAGFMATIWVNNTANIQADVLVPKPDHVVRNVLDIREILQQYGLLQ